MTQAEIRVITSVIASLRGDRLDPKMKPHLDALRIWLDTWIIPPLEICIENPASRDIYLAERLTS